MRNFGITVFIAFLLLNCSEEKLDLRDYYFPLKTLENGKVYLYKDVGSGAFAKEFWYLKSTKLKDGYELNVTILNRHARTTQYIVERSTEGEMKTVRTTLIERNAYKEEFPVEAKVVQPYVFNFALADTSKSLYSNLDWINPIDSLQYTLEKVRYFKGFSVDEIMGEEIKTLNMGINTSFKSFTPLDGETDSEWPGEEKYGKGLGLVYYKRAVDPSILKEMQLIKVYERENFNRLKNVNLK